MSALDAINTGRYVQVIHEVTAVVLVRKYDTVDRQEEEQKSATRYKRFFPDSLGGARLDFFTPSKWWRN